MMIVKVQLSLVSSDRQRRVLIYNEDRSVCVERIADANVIAKMGGSDKAYFPAFVAQDGILDVWFDSPQPVQEW